MPWTGTRNFPVMTVLVSASVVTECGQCMLLTTSKVVHPQYLCIYYVLVVTSNLITTTQTDPVRENSLLEISKINKALNTNKNVAKD